MFTLPVTKREEVGKRSKRLADAGHMPAIVYGPKESATPLTLSVRDFEKVLRDAGESSVISLTGLGHELQVLIHDVDYDPVTSVPRHVDFYAIEKGAKVEVAVPLEFIGESPAVKGGANLVKVMHEIEVSADATKLPHQIDVDISVLADVGQQIHVRDLTIPAGVEVKAAEDDVVALIQEVAVEEEVPTAAPDMSAIEVEKKGKVESAEASATE